MAKAGQAGQGDAAKSLQPASRLGALQGQQHTVPLVIRHFDAPGLQLRADPGRVGFGAGRIDHQQQAVGFGAWALRISHPALVVDDQVIADAARFVQQHRVASLTGSDAEQVGGHEGLEDIFGASAPQAQHPHVGNIKQAAAAAHRLVLRHQAAKLHRHLPAGEGNQAAARRPGRLEQGRAPQGWHADRRRVRLMSGGIWGRISQREVGHGESAAQIEGILWSADQVLAGREPEPSADDEEIRKLELATLAYRQTVPRLGGQDPALDGLPPQLPQLPPLHPCRRGGDGLVPAAPAGDPPGPGLGGLVSPLDGARNAPAPAQRGPSGPTRPPGSSIGPGRITQLSRRTGRASDRPSRQIQSTSNSVTIYTKYSAQPACLYPSCHSRSEPTVIMGRINRYARVGGCP